MPLDPALADVLLHWQRISKFNKPDDWIFASPFKAGTMPWQPWKVQQRHIGPAAVRFAGSAASSTPPSAT